ncbi:nickel ABC transporter ATP-binding protein NikE [Planctomonas psychrotolerans]|uniref:nickel ABC transporter ATP-binding protein NikE n=1 Tax=Planctomonas psychrotolerans TaxID=2528712 RepID=UPI001D0CEBA3|nr:ABC transporter ATP-binding protein [Planctomonas psychrotolerans]
MSAAGATGADPVLRVENLTVGFGASGAAVVEGVSFTVAAGECLALVGESGSGKSVTARSILGLAGARSWQRADAVELSERDLRSLSEREWRSVRGRNVGLILQDALASLDPLRPVGREIADALRLHTRLSPAARAARVHELLRSVGMPEPELRVKQRSGELSGGLRQRALIASAIALDPGLLIADEPTTALDTTVQARILDLLAEQKESGTAVLLISHDLAVVSRVADRVAVLREGRIIETGPTDRVLRNPEEPYTRRLIGAVPTGRPRGERLSVPVGSAPGGSAQRARPAAPVPARATTPRDAVALSVRNVTVRFRGPNGSTRLAVDSASVDLHTGTTLGLVGESGSGKTTLARLALGLIAPDAGEVRVGGEPWNPLAEKHRRPVRARVGAVYQDSLASFDPRLSVEAILTDAATGGARRGSPARSGAADRVRELLDSVGLPAGVLPARPLNLSGGQRQRVAIARALAPRPDILICDEPVSALDVSVQAQVLDLLDELQERHGLSYLFISHDLGVVAHMADRIAVMSEGRIVEMADTDRILAAPQHPFTRRLLDASPRL